MNYTMIDRLKSLGVFAETVREGSFRGAARKLGLTPSAVSYHIRTLEEVIGVPILYRSTRSLSTTAAGESLYRSALEMLNAAQNGLHEASQIETLLSGKLHISLTSALSHSYVSEHIAQFSKEHPSVEMLLHYDNQKINLVGEQIDLALRTGKLDNSSLKCRLIWNMQRKLVASPEFLKENHPIESPQELKNLCWIRFESMVGKRKMYNSQGHKLEITQSGNVVVNSIEAMVDLAVLGTGLASPPSHFVDSLIYEGKLQHILPEWLVETIPVYAVWPPGKVENPITRSFLNGLVERTQLMT